MGFFCGIMFVSCCNTKFHEGWHKVSRRFNLQLIQGSLVIVWFVRQELFHNRSVSVIFYVTQSSAKVSTKFHEDFTYCQFKVVLLSFGSCDKNYFIIEVSPSFFCNTKFHEGLHKVSRRFYQPFKISLILAIVTISDLLTPAQESAIAIAESIIFLLRAFVKKLG